MLTIILKVDAPVGAAMGVKEAIAMDLEKYGDVKVVEIREDKPRQMEIGSC